MSATRAEPEHADPPAEPARPGWLDRAWQRGEAGVRGAAAALALVRPPRPRRRALPAQPGRPAGRRRHLLRLPRALPGPAAGRLGRRAGPRRRRPAAAGALRRDPGDVPRVDRRQHRRRAAGRRGLRRGRRASSAWSGFLYAGLRAMDKLRIGMEQIWKGRVDEPEFWRDNVQDLLALVLLGAVGLLSLALTGVATTATAWTLRAARASTTSPGAGTLTTVLGPAPGAGLRRRRLPVAAQGRGRHAAPAARPAPRGAVRRGRLRGAEAAGQLLPLADRRQRHGVGPRAAPSASWSGSTWSSASPSSRPRGRRPCAGSQPAGRMTARRRPTTVATTTPPAAAASATPHDRGRTAVARRRPATARRRRGGRSARAPSVVAGPAVRPRPPASASAPESTSRPTPSVSGSVAKPQSSSSAGLVGRRAAAGSRWP